MTSDAGRVTGGRVWITAFLAFAILGGVWAFAVPPASAPDEPAHMIYAAAAVRGQLAAPQEDIVDHPAGMVGQRTVVRLDGSYDQFHFLPACYAFRPELPAGCMPAYEPPQPVDEMGTTAGTYPPAYYLAVGWPSLAVSAVPAMYAARLLTVAVCAALLASAALSMARAGGSRWRFVGLALAVTPMAAYLAGAVNPNGVEVAAAIAAWAAAIETVDRPGHRAAVARLGTAGAVLALSRPFGPAWIVGILVVTALLGGRELLRRRGGDRVLGWALGGVGLAVLATVAWLVARGTLDALTGVPPAPMTTVEVVRESLSRLPTRLGQMIGLLGWADVFLPAWIVRLWLAAVGVVSATALVLGTWRQRLALAAVALAALLLPTLSDVSSAREIGFVFQGRYALPVAAGVPLLAGWSIAQARRRWLSGWAPLAVLAAVVVMHLGALVEAMGRYQNGALIAPLRAIVGSAAWEPPVPDLLLLAMMGGAGLALLVAVQRSAESAPSRSAEPSPSAVTDA